VFEVGFSELLLIAAIALIVLGPQKLPKLAQQAGRWIGRARAMARQFREQLEEEAHTLETKMSIDPEIDTSLDSKPKPQPTTAAQPAPVDTPPPVPQTVEEEEFYPPDHHMHSSNRSGPADAPTMHVSGDAPVADAAADASADLPQPTVQTELDLSPPERKLP
jgi:sec-independent protein translocase protein TatB